MPENQMNYHYESLECSDEIISEYSSDCYESLEVEKWMEDEPVMSEDKVAQELPIALVYNGISHVVMMGTPCDLEALALGFSLSEGIIDTLEQFYGIEIEVKSEGIELNIEISTEKFVQLKYWRRNQTGRTGCGLCGAESLKQAIRAVPK
ncbi:MAG: formate dehydrogenase accessory sulfurtransferase FdhD, partial [Gammaproteobacteria bacterium]|nr:formate dehydrogenase accessory sulfurtransferase FdhD [Gammaproteobacteria bacterium]